MARRIHLAGAPEKSGAFAEGSRRASAEKSLKTRIKSVAIWLRQAGDAECSQEKRPGGDGGFFTGGRGSADATAFMHE
jgi:hypothetical protein